MNKLSALCMCRGLLLSLIQAMYHEVGETLQRLDLSLGLGYFFN